MDPYEYLRISRNSDGSLTREQIFPDSTASGELPPDDSVPVLSKDVPLNPDRQTWLRLFVPNSTLSPLTKLPVILFFHGGGFIVLSPATTINHQFCEGLAAGIPAIVVSVKYRLAPEQRLPAAYDDGLDAVLWLRAHAAGDPYFAGDPWLFSRADFSRCFVAGASAGGNIAYHVSLRARRLDLGPLKLNGFILNQPFFGGKQRTKTEQRSGGEDPTLPLAATDVMWELSLPEGADRDHEFCNPPAAENAAGKVKGLPRCLMIGFTGDPLVDRQLEVAGMLEEGGVSVVLSIEEGGFHGADIMETGRAEPIFAGIRDFVNSGEE